MSIVYVVREGPLEARYCLGCETVDGGFARYVDLKVGRRKLRIVDVHQPRLLPAPPALPDLFVPFLGLIAEGLIARERLIQSAPAARSSGLVAGPVSLQSGPLTFAFHPHETLRGRQSRRWLQLANGSQTLLVETRFDASGRMRGEDLEDRFAVFLKRMWTGIARENRPVLPDAATLRFVQAQIERFGGDYRVADLLMTGMPSGLRGRLLEAEIAWSLRPIYRADGSFEPELATLNHVVDRLLPFVMSDHDELER